MSDPTETARRVLELDKQATQGPWDRAYLYEALRHVEKNTAIEQPPNAPSVRGNPADTDVLAEYRTAAPELARALLESQAALANESDEQTFLRLALKSADDGNAAPAAERDALRADLARVTAERDDLQSSADLRHAADRRAIDQWHAAGNDALTFPDHADLVVFLAEQVAHWRAKATAYGDIVHACTPALAAAGHPVGEGLAKVTIAAAVETLRRERDDLSHAMLALVTLAIDSFGYGTAPMPAAVRKSVPLSGKHLHDFLYEKSVEMNALRDERRTTRESVRELVDGLAALWEWQRGVQELPLDSVAVTVRDLLAKHAAPAPTPADAKEDDRG